MTAAESGTEKKATVVLRNRDIENLDFISEFQGEISDAEAIRRSLRLTREILECQHLGGKVILMRDGSSETVRFL